jgi:hypothetical protein
LLSVFAGGELLFGFDGFCFVFSDFLFMFYLGFSSALVVLLLL